ncbi:MAG: stage III sporulation protein AF [Dorea sp.]|jgi:stage III sporulation protein AF|nr:stage III sporulation protein AF [Dorea sp.]
MFDRIYLWVQNLAFYMVMVTAVMHVIPNTEYKRYIRFFTGMVLVVMLTAPFLKFLGIGDSWQNLYHSREYQEQVRKMEEAVRSFQEADGDEYYRDIMTEDQTDTKDETESGGSIHMEETEKAREDKGSRTEGGDVIGVEEIRVGR